MFAKRYFLLAAAAAILAATAHSARAQNNGKEIMALEPAKLVAIVKDPAAGVFEKAKACQRLAVVGVAAQLSTAERSWLMPPAVMA